MSDEYIKAWKCALRLDLWQNRYPVFHGMFHGNYNIDSLAYCENGYHHDAPELGCTCGFYGATQHQALDYNAPIIMEVEFYGKVIKHRFGYRAQKQRVLALYFTRTSLWNTGECLDDYEAMTEEMMLAEISNRTGVECRMFEDLPDD